MRKHRLFTVFYAWIVTCGQGYEQSIRFEELRISRPGTGVGLALGRATGQGNVFVRSAPGAIGDSRREGPFQPRTICSRSSKPKVVGQWWRGFHARRSRIPITDQPVVEIPIEREPQPDVGSRDELLANCASFPAARTLVGIRLDGTGENAIAQARMQVPRTKRWVCDNGAAYGEDSGLWRGVRCASADESCVGGVDRGVASGSARALA